MAAIIHDAELDTTPELVNAAAAAAALALDNERLKADLRARVEDLRISRARIVEAADAARRRLERDLHDGAQQQLVSLALDLRLLRARLKGTDLVPMVEELSDKLAVALAELRELARGIHPAILTDRGLGPAVQGARRPRAAAGRGRRRARRAPGAARSRPPPTSSPPRRSPTSPATRGRARRGWRSGARATASWWSSPTTASAAPTSSGGTGLRGLQDRLAALDGAAGDQQPARRGHATAGGDPGVVDALAALPARPSRCCVAGLAAALRETREPDVVVRSATPAGRPTRPASGAGRVSIWVVTHGQASSAFWTIVRNGVDAASRQADVQVTYRVAGRLRRRHDARG